MQAQLTQSTSFTGLSCAGSQSFRSAVPAARYNIFHGRRAPRHIAAQQNGELVRRSATSALLSSLHTLCCKSVVNTRLQVVTAFQEKSKGGLAQREPESKVVSNDGAGGNGASAQTRAELEKAIGELPPEQQKQLGRLYMFLTQHPEAKIELQSFGDVRRAMDNYQVSGNGDMSGKWRRNGLHVVPTFACTHALSIGLAALSDL